MTTHYTTIVIGAGLSGLTVAHKLRLRDPGHRLLILEKRASTGGVIRSHLEEGYLTEVGPHGFLDNCRESQDILRETGLSAEAVKAPLGNFVRYVFLRGKLQCIPQTPLKISMAPLIPWPDKFRVLAEPWQKPLAGEPTVAKWVAHRFGSALLPFADAVYTGTYAGDYDRLAIDAVMPGVRTMEREYGSVIRGMLGRMRAARKSQGGKKKAGLPAMTSFPQGMGRLPEKLTEPLRPGEDLLLGCAANGIERTSNGAWRIRTARGSFTADNLVLAVPVNASLRLLKSLSTEMAIDSIPEATIRTVAFGFGPGTALPPGFGFLTPECEKRFALGSLFSSNMFPDRAPEGHIVTETLIGGRRHPERLELSADEMVRQAREDIQDILKIAQEPVYTTVLQSSGAIPQLEQGYTRLLDWRDKLTEGNPGLYVCGFGWEGIGLNEMMKTATRVAAAIGESHRTTGGEAEVKKIYF